jgi:hypothetical protein
VDRSQLFSAKEKKVIASVFWNAEGILFIDYLEERKTITKEISFQSFNQTR